jgi:hypothetical protein
VARSSLIAVATFGSVGVAGVISLVWFWVSSGDGRFEPAVGTLGMLGGLTGILAERRASARDRRNAVLATLRDELSRAAEVLAGPVFTTEASPPRVYPRLPVSAVDAALVSGALTERGDTELLNRLHRWRDEVTGFNRRLELTEVRLFGAGAAHEAADFDRALRRDGGYLAEVREHRQALADHLS